MKKIETIYDKALIELKTLREMQCFNFRLGKEDYKYTFRTKNVRPVVISTTELPNIELSIFFLKKINKIFDVLEDKIEQIESKDFELLYAYFKVILQEVDFFSELRNVSGNIKDKFYREDISNGLQARKLDLSSSGLTFPENTKLQRIKPAGRTLKMFEVLDDFISNFSDNISTQKPRIVFKEASKELVYGVRSHSFHKNVNENDTFRLLQSLWEHRQILDNNDIEDVRGGHTRSKEQVAKEMGLINFERDFKDYIKARETLTSAIKSLRRIFKEKNMPIKIASKADKVQLTVKYKE